MALAIPATADSRIKIDSVPAQYQPAYSMSIQPVSLGSYRFEADEQTGRVRVVVEYAYQIVNPGRYDPGPQPSMAQIPGLTWNAATRSAVYEANGKQTVCAVAEPGKHLKLKNTGACTVTATENEHTTDDGWSLHHPKTIDTWFQVQ